MVTIKFEVNEDYIRRKADIKSMLENESTEKALFLKMMIQLIAFGGIESELDKGKKDFVVRQDDLDDKLTELFEHTIDEVLFLAHTSSLCDGEGNDKKDEKETKESEETE